MVRKVQTDCGLVSNYRISIFHTYNFSIFENYNYVINPVLSFKVVYHTSLLYNIDFFSLFVPSNHHHVISETYNFTTVNHIYFSLFI